MLVSRIVMVVRMRMAGAIGVLVLMLVELDLQAPPECLGDPAQGREAWDMIAALQARDHRLGHAESIRQPSLCLARLSPKLEQAARTFGGDHGAVVCPAFAPTCTFPG
jgi:hypothetical protein